MFTPITLNFASGSATSGFGSKSHQLVSVALLVSFVLIVGLVFYIASRQKKAMADLATKNGWQPLAADDNTLANYLPQYLRNNPESIGHKYEMAYKAQVSGQDIVFFKYDDDVRVHELNNPSANQRIPYSVAAFEVPQTFGTLYIFHHSRVSNMGLHNGLQKFSLEGDFSRYFDVYAPSGSSVETLSVLTPDVMALLEDLGQHWHWNIQISGHIVIIEGDSNLISSSKVQSLLSYAATMKQKLSSKPLTTN